MIDNSVYFVFSFTDYYPSGGMQDLLGHYHTYDAAKDAVIKAASLNRILVHYQIATFQAGYLVILEEGDIERTEHIKLVKD